MAGQTVDRVGTFAVSPRFIKSAARASDFPPDSGSEIAVVGRSNSGKSTVINRLTGAQKLARVSRTPGRTQLVNFFELAPDRRLVDLPGYGFARVPEAVRLGWRRLVGDYLQRSSLCGVMITVDIRRGLKPLDADMLAWTDDLGLPVLVLLNKADKLSREAGHRQLRAVQSELPASAAIALFSGLTGLGIDEARAWIERALDVKSREHQVRI
jgi:GTP-binding protein